MNGRRLMLTAFAIAAVSCGGGNVAGSVGDTTIGASTDVNGTASAGVPTNPGSTSVEGATSGFAPGTPLIGAAVTAEHDLLFTASDPTWNLYSLTVSYQPVLSPGLLLVADGDALDRAVASVTVGPASTFSDTIGNSATTGAVIEPVRVGEVDSLGWSVAQNGIPISSVQWPAPNGYHATIVAIGLDLEATAELATGVGFEGTTPTFEADPGFHVIPATDPNARTVSALFAHGGDGLRIGCSNSGEAGMFGYQMSAFARVAPRTIGDGVIAQRADATFGPPSTALDGAAWLAGEWWCQAWSSPLSDSGGTVPVIADEAAEALLASLTIVDEQTLRQSAGDAPLVLDAEPPAAPPTPSAPTDPFSGGDAAAAGQWHAMYAPGGDRILAVGSDVTSSVPETVAQFIATSTGARLRSFLTSSGWACGTGYDVTISDDGTMLWDGQSIRDTTTGEVVSTPQVAFGRPVGGDFSSDGSMLAVSGGRDKRVIVVSTVTGEVQHTLTSGDYIAMCAEFLPGDLQLHVPGLMPADRIWDLATETIVATFTVNDGPTLLSPDGKYLAIMDEIPRILEVDTGSEVAAISGMVDEFSDDGNLALVIPSSVDGSRTPEPALSEIWDMSTGQRRCTVSTQADLAWFVTDFSPDGSRLASTRGSAMDVYDTATCEVVGTLDSDGGGILSVDYSPDGTQIVTANANGRVQIWSAP